MIEKAKSCCKLEQTRATRPRQIIKQLVGVEGEKRKKEESNKRLEKKMAEIRFVNEFRMQQQLLPPSSIEEKPGS